MSAGLKLCSPKVLFWSGFARFILPTLAITSVAVAQVMIFLFVPNEAQMGAVQRVFYFHVGAALATYTAIGVMLIAAFGYLSQRASDWDLIGSAATFVAFLLATIVLVSGMIWGHSAWNTWWRWEPRLVSFLVLWLVLFAMMFMRRVTDSEVRRANFQAILSIFAAVNVPIVIYSIKLLSHAEQLHPQVIAQQGIRDWRFGATLGFTVVAVHLLALWLWWLKLSTLVLAKRVQGVR